jgi:hypothetical protein
MTASIIDPASPPNLSYSIIHAIKLNRQPMPAHVNFWKAAILDAAQIAGGGGQEGLRDYLVRQAHENPGPFMSLLGRVLPHQLAAGGGGITVVIQRFTDDHGQITANPSAAIDADYKRLSGPTDNK